MIRVISETHHTMDDCILDGYARMIRSCVSWAVAEACRPKKPSPTATEFLDDFIPRWREIYADQYEKIASIQSDKPSPERIVELFWQGHKPRTISKLLNISTKTVQRHLDERGISHRRKSNANRTVQLSES